MKRRARTNKNRRETKIILFALFLSVTPAIAAVAMIVLSSRPDFYYTDLSGRSRDETSQILGWPSLRSHSMTTTITDRVVQLPGYMMPFVTGLHDYTAGNFLLVPDPGNWLHPPHLEPDEVVLVRIQSAARLAVIERRAVWVRGRMSVAPLRNGDLNVVYRMDASEVWNFGEGPR